MKTLNCFYDMAVSPCSYDFFTFLFSAENCRARRGLDTIKLIFVHGTDNYFRTDNIRTLEQNKNFFENVIIPGISLLPFCSSFLWIKRDEINLTEMDPTFIFPRGYKPASPVAEYIPGELIASSIRGDTPSFLHPPEYALALAKSYIDEKSNGKPVVVLTTRELERENKNKTRNIDNTIWKQTFEKLKHDYTPIIIRDTATCSHKPLFDDVIECPQASIHLPFRMALYTLAFLNFTKNTGPSLLLLYGKTNTVYFAEYDNDEIALSEKWFLENFGMVEKSQYPMTTVSKQFYWGKEDQNNILDICKNTDPDLKNSLKLNKLINKSNAQATMISGFKHLLKITRFNLLVEDIHLFKGLEKLNSTYRIFDNLESEFLKFDGNLLPKGTAETLIRESKKYA